MDRNERFLPIRFVAAFTVLLSQSAAE